MTQGAAGEGSQVPTAGVGATPGELLRAERERRGLSLQQTAEDLHLDTWIVEAIETNRFLALGAPVYAKGHLRKYAMLLNLSPDVVVARYQALSGTPEVPTHIPSTVAAPVPRPRRSLRAPLVIVAILLAAALIWWLVTVLTKPVPATPPAIVTSAQTTVAPTAAPTTAETREGAARAATPVAPAPAPAASVPPSTAPATAIPVGNDAVVRLRLEFGQPSWVEIYDAAGQRLLFDTGTPERPRAVSGIAPLRVVLGAAAGVTAEVNGRSVAVPQRPGRDDTRFVVNADGSVR